MGAPQHDLVGAALEHRGDGPADELLGFGRLLAVGLDRLDEAAAGNGDDLDALAVTGGGAAEQVAVEAALGGEHPHHPAFGSETCGLDGGLHADDRQRRIFGAQEVDSGGGSGPAGCRR